MNAKNRRPLHEAADRCGVAPEVIVRFVSFHWVLPVDWQHEVLDEEDIARVRLICELQHEFGVNDEAIPIILRLIDQLNRTHLELKIRRSGEA
jgi:chaperone modulatory protein CbpM